MKLIPTFGAGLVIRLDRVLRSLVIDLYRELFLPDTVRRDRAVTRQIPFSHHVYGSDSSLADRCRRRPRRESMLWVSVLAAVLLLPDCKREHRTLRDEPAERGLYAAAVPIETYYAFYAGRSARH